MTAETGSGIAVVGACREGACRKGAYRKGGGISGKVGVRGRVGINSKVGIGASSGKDVFRLSGVPLLLYEALSIIYSGEVGK